MAMKVTVGGQVFLTDDLTIEEAERVEDATGESWLYINPLRSAKHCKAIMRQFALRSMSEAEADKAINGLTVKEALEAVESVTEDSDLAAEWVDGMPDPKAEAAGSTSGSSGEPESPAAGLPT